MIKMIIAHEFLGQQVDTLECDSKLISNRAQFEENNKCVKSATNYYNYNDDECAKNIKCFVITIVTRAHLTTIRSTSGGENWRLWQKISFLIFLKVATR